MSLTRNRYVFPLLGITTLVGMAAISACHGSGASSPQEDEPETEQTAAALSGTVEGYASATSVVQGGTLSFHASDGALASAAPYPIQILRKGLSTTWVMSDVTFPIKAEATPADAYATGAGWPKVYDLAVGDTWPSGLYVAKIGTPINFTTVPFVVRPKVPGAVSKVLFQLPINTTQAYNNWGGKSLYTFNSTNKAASVRVSFNRPTGNSHL